MRISIGASGNYTTGCYLIDIISVNEINAFYIKILKVNRVINKKSFCLFKLYTFQGNNTVDCSLTYKLKCLIHKQLRGITRYFTWKWPQLSRSIACSLAGFLMSAKGSRKFVLIPWALLLGSALPLYTAISVRPLVRIRKKFKKVNATSSTVGWSKVCLHCLLPRCGDF